MKDFVSQTHQFIRDNFTWLSQIVIALLITLVVFCILFIVIRLFQSRHHDVEEKGIWMGAFFKALEKPLYLFVWVVGIIYSLRIVRDSVPDLPILSALNTAETILFILLLLWFCQRFVTFSKERALSMKGKQKPDVTTVHALTKLGRLVIWALAALVVMQEFGVPLSGVVAFGGGSALIIGIAAKDLIANFFGGWVVIMDKPFKVGDWIASPDKDIEGTVEYIGWRSTRIRTFDKRPLYVPNALFTTVCIVNPSRMQSRRIKTLIGVRYDDASKIAGITEEVETMLKNHPEINQNFVTFIALVSFGDFSLDMLLYTFTKTTDWVKFQKIQQDVFLKIIQIIEARGAACAFPTTTLEVPKGIEMLDRDHMPGGISDGPSN